MKTNNTYMRWLRRSLDNKSLRRLRRWGAMAFPAALFLFSSCSNDTPDPIVKEETPAFLSFTVAVETPSSATRGGEFTDPQNGDNTISWGDNYLSADGNAFENLLLGKDFFTPVVYEVSGGTPKQVGDFELLTFSRSFLNNTTYYHIHGRFKPNSEYDDVALLKDGSKDYRMAVFANIPNNWDVANPGNLITSSDPANYGNIVYSHMSDGNPVGESVESVDAIDHGFDAIPMWGVTKVDFSGLKQGEVANITPVACKLLRAMAKVTVTFDLKEDQKNRVRLESLHLNYFNESGIVIPKEWMSAKYTTDLKYSDSFNAKDDTRKSGTDTTDSWLNGDPRDASIDESVFAYSTKKVYGLNESGKEGKISFYLPEVTNEEDRPLILNVRYTVGEDLKQNQLYFTQYSDGKPQILEGKTNYSGWNIVRNHIYEYTVTGVQDSKIDVQVRVNNWKYHVSPVQPLE